MKKILLVDDEDFLCRSVKRSLEASGDFEVDVLLTGKGLLERAGRLRPDLILLDVLMPGKSGTALAAELKESASTKDIPIIFLTGIIKGEEVQRQGNVIGGEYFVAKPVETAELISVIKRVIG